MMSLLKDVIGYGAHADRPASGSQGRLYYETDTSMLFRDSGTAWVALLWGGNALTKLDEVVVPSGGAPTISFNPIPGSYRSLQLTAQARGDAATTAVALGVQFNGDTGANYDWNEIYGIGSVGQDAHVTQTAIIAGTFCGATAPAAAAGAIDILLPNYAATTFQKSLRAVCVQERGSAVNEQQSNVSSGFWLSTAAITSILLLCASGGNFVEGSVASLYGIS